MKAYKKKYRVYLSSYDMGTLNIKKESPLKCVLNWCFISTVGLAFATELCRGQFTLLTQELFA